MNIVDRKRDHIEIVRSGRARAGVTAGFDDIRFAHCALPELDLGSVDLSTRFLGRSLRLPFLISSMTGGPARAEAINVHLAEAAQALGIAFAVGSQRVALQQGALAGFSPTLRRLAPDVPIYANFGAVQLVNGFGLAEARRAIDMIEADALILHLNPLQECIQEDGDVDWKGVSRGIEQIVRELKVPIIVKETGCGISPALAVALADRGVSAIDVAGAGGTSWAAVEGARSATPSRRAMGEIFRDWGIPTATALSAIAEALPQMPLIGSGGIRNGLDAAKAIRLGAALVGQAAPVLEAGIEGPEQVVAHFEEMTMALRIACFCTGSASLARLRDAPLL
jgi:isopentenyl-diphosphate delta-isomerase